MATLLHDIREYDRLVQEIENAFYDEEEVDVLERRVCLLERRMRAALPLVKRFGLFELFPVKEWKQGGSRGRKFVGLEAEKMGF